MVFGLRPLVFDWLERGFIYSFRFLTMEKTNFENLDIYKWSEKLADQIWKVVVRWEVLAKDTLGKQLVRAADSVGANIAKGSSRGTEPELRRFLRISRGSLYETKQVTACI